MKKLILITVGILLAVTAYAKDIQELVVTTNPPMSCQNCENKIKKNLRFEKGVKNIETNLSEQRVTIEYDADKTDANHIEEAFKKIGYQVEVIPCEGQENPEAVTCPKTGGACCGNSCKGE